jgi:hypothetical protein
LGLSTLYRYRSCSTPYFEDELSRLLEQNALFFPSQPHLNDPFDCQPVLKKGVTFREFREYLDPVICVIRTEMARELRRIDVSDQAFRRVIKRNIKAESWLEQRTVFDHRLDKMIVDGLSDTCVLGLTKDNNNPVMWSMYGNRGNGICIEFDQIYIEQPRGVGAHDLRMAPTQVRYTCERPVFDYNGATAMFLNMTRNAANYVPKRYHRRMLAGLEQVAFLWTKHERWAYEEEFRLIMQRDYPRQEENVFGEYIKIGRTCLSAIYVGDTVNDETVSKILIKTRACSRSVNVYKGHRSTMMYGLVFDPLSGSFSSNDSSRTGTSVNR